MFRPPVCALRKKLKKMKDFLLELLYLTYKGLVSPALHLFAGPGMGCRYSPTCGDYTFEVLKNRGWIRGSFLAIKRVLSCHPYARLHENRIQD